MTEKARKVKIPYENTKISPEDTKAGIEKMLKKNGITDIQWTSTRGEEYLRFAVEATVRGVRRTIGFEIRPPTILAKKRIWNTKQSRYELINVPMWAQAWRLVFWYLETKLKAIEYGLVSVEKELMAQIMVPIGQDRYVSLGDIIERQIAEDKLAKLPSPEEMEEERTFVKAEEVKR